MTMLTAAAVTITSALLGSPQSAYEAIPPDPYQMEQTLSAARVDAAKAITIATAEVMGSCSSLVAQVTGNKVNYLITVYSSGKNHEILVDGSTGAIMQNTEKNRFPGEDIGDLEVITTPEGLMYVDLVEGDGAMPPNSSANVTVHYSGYLTDGTKFDSSLDKGQPITFPLNGVIPGWTKGVGSMKIGGKRKLIIPYAMAYGANGRPPVIPPKATLIFDVELLEIK